jgi:2-polyprenyl-6-methoxyphenol hydroxylase-like FAD-dependent oxidoreductase
MSSVNAHIASTVQLKSARKRRAIVIGGSLSGLFAASLLRNAGWHTEVFERSDAELSGRGAGIVTHQDLIQSLERSGADLRDLGVHITDRIALSQTGEVIERIDFDQTVTSWDRLHSIMRATIPEGTHHLGCNLVDVEQEAHRVTAVFSDGRRETGDLLVAADGYRSTVRGILAPDIQPIYAGYVVWRGVAEEADIPQAARDAIFNTFAFFLPPRNKNIGYPIAGPGNNLNVGGRRYNWVWYRPVDTDTLNDMLIGSDGVAYELSVPPPKVRDDLIAQLRSDADAMLPPPMRDTLNCVSRPFFTPIYDLVSDRLVYGRIAIIGDAASVARPHIGMGIAKAGTDAEVLADCLVGDTPIEEGLARFEAARIEVARRAVQQGRDLGEYMLEYVSPEIGAADPRWQKFHSTHGILTQTASSAFLREAE